MVEKVKNKILVEIIKKYDIIKNYFLINFKK